MPRRHRRLLATAAALVAACLALLVQLPVPASAVGAHAQIQGSGSSWAYNSIQQWISDTQSQGLQVVFTPSGSAAGRKDFANGVSDYAVSDIGFQGVNPQTGYDDVSSRAYAYLPVVGGGTAFPYHLTVRGQLVRNLRLSQPTLAKIFTDQITNWDDPAITADNNGVQFPSIPIVPTVHSEGAGTTYQVTDWLSRTFPSLWQGFFGAAYPVEYWPNGKGGQQAENGSDGMMSFIDSSAGQGSIGYDEYSYALQAGYPVAKVENTAGYFTAPDQYNVAVALTQAQINEDPNSANYLLEDLSHVWGYSDPRTYPLSSYSYFIEPTAANDEVDTAKRQTIVDYLSYSLCQGQGEMGPIGYSPLPVNLVQASFQQLSRLHTADPNVSLQNVNVAQCHNPTFDPSNLNVNRLAEIAPQPPSCDKAGQGPCGDGVGIVIRNPTANGQVPGATPGGGSSGGSGAGAGGAGASNGASSGGGARSSGGHGSSSLTAAAASSSAGGGTATGSAGAQTGSPGGTGSGGVAGGAGDGGGASVQPRLVVTNLAADHVAAGPGEIVAAVLLLGLLAAPPALIRLRGRRKETT